MKTTLWSALVVLLLAGVSPAQEAAPDPEALSKDGLVKQKGRFAEIWMRPDVDFSRYSKLIVRDPAFEFRNVASAPTGSLIKRDGGIREREQESFSTAFSESFIRELKDRERFQLVEDVGPDTLVLDIAVIDVVANVSPESTHRVESWVSRSGAATIALELRDSETGEIQAVAGERRGIRTPDSSGIGLYDLPADAPTLWVGVGHLARNIVADLCREVGGAKNDR